MAPQAWVTASHFFRNLAGYVVGRPRTFVVQYPEERVDYADAFRGMPVLVQLENGQPRCVACGLCEFACPTDCITIVPGELENAGIERYPEQFDIDMSRCMFCGLCEEACPTSAIQLTPLFETCERDILKLVYEKEDLLVDHGGKDKEYNFYRYAGIVTDVGGKGEHVKEDKPVNIKSNMP